MANRRSESPQDKSSFTAIRAKLESLSPNYSSAGEATTTTTCEATVVTMAAAPGRSTPNDGGSSDEATSSKDIPIKMEHLLSGAGR